MALKLNDCDRSLIKLALEEDLGSPFIDITMMTLKRNKKLSSTAKVVSKNKADFVFCGLAVIKEILQHFPDDCHCHSFVEDGDTVYHGQTLVVLSGDSQIISMTERVVLNFIQYLSAIATTTRYFVRKIQHTGLQLLDTRKTLPGFRHLAKYAVQCGGGVNHRMGLYDALLIKDNHIDLMKGVKPCLAMLPDDILQHHDVVMEVRSINELEELLLYGKGKVKRVLLDNMSIKELCQAVSLCQGHIVTEASGAINLTNIEEIAQTGVNYASLGCLTHSPCHIDLSMKISQ